MKLVSLILLLVALVHGQKKFIRQASGEFIPIVSNYNEHNYDGSYRYGYQTGNGISVEEEGSLKPGGESGDGIQTARGSYSYPSPDGKLIYVTWYADETGFHAQVNFITVIQDFYGSQTPVTTTTPETTETSDSPSPRCGPGAPEGDNPLCTKAPVYPI